MGSHIGEAGVDLGDAVGLVRRFRFDLETAQLLIRVEHRREQGTVAARCFLCNRHHARPRVHKDRSRLGREGALDKGEKRRLAGAVAPHETDLRAGGDVRAGPIEQEPVADAIGERVDLQHAAAFSMRAASPRALGKGAAFP